MDSELTRISRYQSICCVTRQGNSCLPQLSMDMDLHQKTLESLAAFRDEPRLLHIQKALGSYAGLYLVGGTVRDTLLKRPTKDIDLAFSRPIAEAIQSLESAGIRVIPTGLQHDTITVLPIADLPPIEITSCRKPSDAKQTDLNLPPIELDLRGRDFTINAIAYSLGDSAIIDPLFGIDDLNSLYLRAVGSPNVRFEEDPLRILRMIRFAYALGMSIDQSTLEAAHKTAHLVEGLSPERIREELNHLVVTDVPSAAIRLLHQVGVLRLILPELAATANFEQNEYHREDLFNHTLDVVDGVEADLILRLGALFHDIAKPHCLSTDENGFRHFYKHESVGVTVCAEIMERLRYSKRDIEAVTTLVKTHMRPVDSKAPGIRRLLRDTAEQYPRWRILKEADSLACLFDPKILAEQLSAFDQAVAAVQAEPSVSPLSNLAINGQDLIALGFTEGPAIGETLRELHELVLDRPQDNERDLLLALSRTRLIRQQ